MQVQIVEFEGQEEILGDLQTDYQKVGFSLIHTGQSRALIEVAFMVLWRSRLADNEFVCFD